MMSPPSPSTVRTKVFMYLWRLSISGGIPRVVRSLLDGLDYDSFDVHVCTARPAFEEDRLYDLPAAVSFSTLGLVGDVSSWQKLRATRLLSGRIADIRPDVVHTHSGVGWYAAPWALADRGRTRKVLEVHDAPQSDRVSRLNNSLEAVMLRRLGIIPLVHSNSVRSDLAAAAKLDETRIATVPIGIEVPPVVDRSGREEWRRSRGIGPDETVITYIARLVESKNPFLFFEVAADVIAVRPDCRFVLIGNGPEATALESIGKAVPENGLMLLKDVADVHAALGASDIFLSTSEYEGFGIAVLEAMAAGLPIVTTAAGGVSDLVDPARTGMIRPLGDRRGLANAVLQLVDDAELRARLGQAGHERARSRFNLQAMVAAYQDLYLSKA